MKFIRNFFAVSILVCASSSIANATSFYIHAHPDDIELFMARSAWNDVASGGKVIFVNTTAGDAGRGTGPTPGSPSSTPFYRARQMGHERAIRFWASLQGNPLPNTTYSYVAIAGKSISRAAIGNNIVIYNMVLPDAAYAGNPNSLAGLKSGAVSTLATIDGTANYTYADLKAVLRGIVSTESHGDPVVFANIPDEDTSVNVGDHTDHTETAVAAVIAFNENASFYCVNLVRYEDYVIQNWAQNFSASELLLHAGTWGSVNSGLADGGSNTTWNATHNGWLGRQYPKAPSGYKPSCTF